MADGKTSRKFGTFEGVFTPAVLTIIGVIFFLRLGWVVGVAGLGGAILIMVIAHLITISYGLSLSSICTNTKVGAGGSYDIIAKSLGLEIGGAIGLPLYFSFSLGAAMYIIGFTEAWNSLFPSHDPRLVASIALGILLVLSYISAKLAMKFQFLIMAIIAFAVVSFFSSRSGATLTPVTWGSFTKVGFWGVFAIFFPAVTGTEAGAAMSGDLKNPRKSIPLGILSAIAVTFVLYIAAALWLSRLADPLELKSNTNAMIDLARWPWVVIAAIMGATISSALACLVSGPRTLQALAQHRITPFSSFFARKSKGGDPRNAILLTGLIVEVNILLGKLDTIAPLLTMFFLITYAMVNSVVFIEQSIGIVSFRPTFRVPKGIPLFGAVAALVAMFLINFIFSIAAILVIIVVYLLLIKKHMKVHWGDVRGAIFVSIAEWAAKTATRFPQHAKSWKPNILVPIEEPKVWATLIRFVRDIIYPSGTLRVFHVNVRRPTEKKDTLRQSKTTSAEKENEHMMVGLDHLVAPLKEEDLFVTTTTIEADDFIAGSAIVMQTLRRAFFPPNTLFVTMSEDTRKDDPFIRLVQHGQDQNLGVIVLKQHPKMGFANRKTINLWLREKSPNKDLAVLVGIQLTRNWEGSLRLLNVVSSESEVKRTRSRIERFRQIARMPAHTEVMVLTGDFSEVLSQAPETDLNIFGLAGTVDSKLMRNVCEAVQTTCLFVKDSGAESAFA
jgi:solute carrier family 12 sodium/potassium/chloride transporter 2